MKSNYAEERYFVECSCGSPDELLIFDIYVHENKIEDISVYLTSPYYLKWYSRLRIAFNYLIGKTKYIESSEVMINKKNIADLEEVIGAIKRVKNYK